MCMRVNVFWCTVFMCVNAFLHIFHLLLHLCVHLGLFMHAFCSSVRTLGISVCVPACMHVLLTLTVHRECDGLAGFILPVPVVDSLCIIAPGIRRVRRQNDQGVVQGDSSVVMQEVKGHRKAEHFRPPIPSA